MIGTSIGTYRITTKLGAGGMGEVYRARDTKLDRDVAIKILPDSFAHDAERVARFEREAKVLAALNHPNIAQIYGLEERALVMELVEGPTLAERIAQGPVPLDEALAIARQVAEAVEAAHEKGIVHRDLKPGNINIKADGTVKVLDFGLAKMGGTPTAHNDESPTMTIGQTEAGVILGTASYMSPEQAKGKQVDQRADIYAFGAVLYEMITGKRLHLGETTTEVLASVIKEEPQWDKVPPQVRKLLRRCLEKDPQKRLRHIGDVMALVDETPVSTATILEQPKPRRLMAARWLWITTGGLLILTIAARVAWTVLRPKTDQPILQVEINPPDGVKFAPGLTPFALSPDGSRLIFVGVDAAGKLQLWMRSINSGTTAALSGTEGAEIPFWSPDSRWVGFSANGKLQKFDIMSGGRPQFICDIDGRAGGTWNSDGVIVFDQSDKPLQRVPAAGGIPVPILPLDAGREETRHGAPYFLPDGRHLLYYSATKKGGLDLMIGSLDGKVHRLLVEHGGPSSYAPNPGGGGSILYWVRGQLTARPFDLNRLEFTGPAVAIADGVLRTRGWYASATGLLAYRHSYGTRYQLAWFGRDGKLQGNVGTPAVLSAPRISPDQMTIAFTRIGDENDGIWTFRLGENTTTRFTFEPAGGGVWSSDSKRIIYRSSGSRSVVARLASGVGVETVIAGSTEKAMEPTSVSRDGRWLVYTELNTVYSAIGIRSLQNPTKVIHIHDHDREIDGAISPDGRWLSYSSVAADHREIFVQSVPDEAGGSASATGKWQISTEGGAQPAWRGDGKEIFYVAPDATMMAVPIESGADFFRPGEPKALFPTHLEFDPALDISRRVRQYDVTPDGQRFLLNQHIADGADAPITVIVNWPKLLAK